MAFLLNLYDATLDLSDKEDRKLYESGYKGLHKDQRFNGSKEKFREFAKLLALELNLV